MTVDTRKLIGNTDATLWAEAWCQTATELVEEKAGVVTQDAREVIDIGWMIGWFANAIMAGFDEGYTREKRDMARLLYALNQGWNRAQFEYVNEKDLWVEDSLSDVLPCLKGSKVQEVLGDPTEYELVPSYPVAVDSPTEHLYADEDVARVAQELEYVRDLLGDLLVEVEPASCVYDGEELCEIHFVGRPCPVELARSYING